MSFVAPHSRSSAPASHGILQPFAIEEPIQVWFGRYLEDDEDVPAAEWRRPENLTSTPITDKFVCSFQSTFSRDIV